MIDMRGYRVAHGNQVYDCLRAEPIWGEGRSLLDSCVYPQDLQVWVIDHSAKLAVITDAHSMFRFFKESES
jgi:hypothetical protein